MYDQIHFPKKNSNQTEKKSDSTIYPNPIRPDCNQPRFDDRAGWIDESLPATTSTDHHYRDPVGRGAFRGVHISYRLAVNAPPGRSSLNKFVYPSLTSPKERERPVSKFNSSFSVCRARKTDREALSWRWLDLLFGGFRSQKSVLSNWGIVHQNILSLKIDQRPMRRGLHCCQIHKLSSLAEQKCCCLCCPTSRRNHGERRALCSS